MEYNIIIIIVNYNQPECTTECIQSLTKSDYKDFGILLIDNSSNTNLSAQLLKSIKIINDKRVIILNSGKNLGYVGGINLGFQKGRGFKPQYFLIMNNDTVIDKHAIGELVNTCKSYNNNAIVSGKVFNYDRPNILQNTGYIFQNSKILKTKQLGLNEMDNGQYDTKEERDMLDDIFWLFPAKLYEEIGGYSTFFWFNAEQADFALRAKKKNYKLIYSPKAKLWHMGSVSIGGRSKNPKLAYWNIQSSLILRYIHLEKVYFIIFFLTTINSVFRSTLKSIFYFITFRKPGFLYAYAKWRGLFYFIIWLVRKNENSGKCPIS